VDRPRTRCDCSCCRSSLVLPRRLFSIALCRPFGSLAAERLGECERGGGIEGGVKCRAPAGKRARAAAGGSKCSRRARTWRRVVRAEWLDRRFAGVEGPGCRFNNAAVSPQMHRISPEPSRASSGCPESVTTKYLLAPGLTCSSEFSLLSDDVSQGDSYFQ
jgi:hypothetical protein